MTQGVLMFAFDNDWVKYTRFAAWSAKRIHRYLGLPVSLITNSTDVTDPVFDQILSQPAKANGVRQGTWYNLDRYLAGKMSPYDQTLLLDADYVVCGDQLACLFDSNQDLLAMTTAYDVTGRSDYHDLNTMGRHAMPSAWATVIYWRRSVLAQQVFNFMGMIQQNWQHYKDIYGIQERRFRNDYALAIALNTMHGHRATWPAIPWSMANVGPDCVIASRSADTFDVTYELSSKTQRRVRISAQDFHVMDKTQMEKLTHD
jgi:hypothetical protein